MITVKQVMDQYRLVLEDEIPEVRKLHQLSEAGLFDGARLPMMKRALEKNPRDMTMVEKKALMELADSLMSQVLHEARPDRLSKYDTRFPRKFPSDRDIPAIIILKRKAIRVFPDNQKIALYYSQALDKYVSVPFGKKDEALGIHMSEQTKPLTKFVTEETQETPAPTSTPRNSFSQHLKQLREEQLDEALPLLPIVGGAALAAARTAGSRVIGGAINLGKKLLSKKPGAPSAPSTAAKPKPKTRPLRRLARRTGAAVAAAAGASKGGEKDDKSNNSGPRDTDSNYEFKKGGRAEPAVSAPTRATADMSSTYSQRQQNKAVWRGVSEQTNFQIIRAVSEDRDAKQNITFGEKTISINNRIAKKVMNLYESLNRENKKKTRRMLNESAESFRKIVNFAVRQ